jgi:hypothetical protein
MGAPKATFASRIVVETNSKKGKGENGKTGAEILSQAVNDLEYCSAEERAGGGKFLSLGPERLVACVYAVVME